MMLIIDLRDEALVLLENFISRAMLSFWSGKLADNLGYSEPELLYRVGFLEEAVEQAKWGNNWPDKQISFFR